MSIDLIQQQEQTRKYIETALRVWATAGLDTERGTFLEALDFEGNPLPNLPRRGRVQTRQVYVYALAHLYGYDKSGEYLTLAENVSRTSEALYRHPEGGWQFLLDPSGAVTKADRFAYEQAFWIMSLSALHHATQKPEYAAKAEECWQWLEGLRHSGHGGFNLGLPHNPLALREQNPHMHLLEACLEAEPLNPAWRARADELYTLGVQRFVTPEGALVEFFGDDWTPDPGKGRDVQPGHHFEWVWLLTQYAKRSGQWSPAIELLYRTGSEWGLDANGLGVDEVRTGGGVIRGTKRLWVECEVLKGHLARYETTREAVYLERAQHVLDQTFRQFLIEDKGVWYDQLDESGKNISENAPASTFYHLLVALQEFIRVTTASA